jgi:hypothetical protein
MTEVPEETAAFRTGAGVMGESSSRLTRSGNFESAREYTKTGTQALPERYIGITTEGGMDS